MLEKRLLGRVYIVTGGTQGLGKKIAEHIAREGAVGIVICGRNELKGQAVAAALSSTDCRCVFVKADLQNVADCKNVVRNCDREFGGVHGLVNAAGLSTRGGIEDAGVELWDRLFAVNVRAPFLLSQGVIRVMKRERIKGSIVNIVSKSAHGGQPFLTVYSASKGALATLTKNIAYAMLRDRIRVNGVNLGWMYTEGEDKVQKEEGKSDNWLELVEKEQPFGRLIYPEDVAKLVVYLLSDDTEMMTGSLIDFDQNVIGGMD
jgi:NAD(P)-dependent dehydrogenase (short-subunit alcohol dehydrogenase family)